MKKLIIGVLAHVDAGKTTLSEAILYKSGSIRKLGRVDNKNAFLDTGALERERGITIFSKQAIFALNDYQISLLDTPGHVDFSAEMERTLQILDYAILVISGADGVSGHTLTLWKLLDRYQIPVFIFINKMDQAGTDSNKLITELRTRLDEGCVDFGQGMNSHLLEQLAMCEEALLEQYIETGKVETGEIVKLIKKRKVFPCFFGSALKMEGIETFMQGLAMYLKAPEYGCEFGARIYKIARDEQGNRLTFMKITGGTLKVKSLLTEKQEKINQIRIYSGLKYETVTEAEAGTICAVTGLTQTRPGQCLGQEKKQWDPLLKPVLSYCINLPPEIDQALFFSKLKQLEEEDPQLNIVWNAELAEIQVQIMGEVQLEILKSLILERFAVDVTFGTGSIMYKETILHPVEGVGHFEPLRHYAEVHLILEPLEPGSGIVFSSDCSEDILDKNWQNLILFHLKEKEHKGVLTGSPITDISITLAAGRAHLKHTEGSDFRQAAHRAVRQGLMQSESVLLEPYFEYRLEVPEKMIGRAMTDLERMKGSFGLPVIDDEAAVFTGEAPVSAMKDYAKEVAAYTKGQGRLFCTLQGYQRCHNTEEILSQINYYPDSDLLSPADSVFCSHGAGFVVKWDRVKEFMHLDSVLPKKQEETTEYTDSFLRQESNQERWIDTEEIDQILERTFYSNKRDKTVSRNGIRGKIRPDTGRQTDVAAISRTVKKQVPLEEYLLIDGYNVIFAWEDLKELAAVNLDSARGKLLDLLCNYQAIRNCTLIVVFDAYRVKGHDTEIFNYHNIHVVFTKEAETADQYIEKFAFEHGKKYQVTVVTSDGMEQIIIRGQGCNLISSREFKLEAQQANARILEQYQEKNHPV